jgi:hypothetical protein
MRQNPIVKQSKGTTLLLLFFILNSLLDVLSTLHPWWGIVNKHKNNGRSTLENTVIRYPTKGLEDNNNI